MTQRRARKMKVDFKFDLNNNDVISLCYHESREISNMGCIILKLNGNELKHLTEKNHKVRFNSYKENGIKIYIKQPHNRQIE